MSALDRSWILISQIFDEASLNLNSYPIQCGPDLKENACFFIFVAQFESPDPNRTGPQKLNELTELVRCRIAISRSRFGTESTIIDFEDF